MPPSLHTSSGRSDPQLSHCSPAVPQHLPEHHQGHPDSSHNPFIPVTAASTKGLALPGHVSPPGLTLTCVCSPHPRNKSQDTFRLKTTATVVLFVCLKFGQEFAGTTCFLPTWGDPAGRLAVPFQGGPLWVSEAVLAADFSPHRVSPGGRGGEGWAVWVSSPQSRSDPKLLCRCR